MFNNQIDFESAVDTFGVLPNGTYSAIVEKIGKVMWVDGEGQLDCSADSSPETSDHYIALTFSLLDDGFKGRKHFANLKLWDDNPTVANIDRIRFKELCLALNIDPGKGNFTDLINKPLKITLRQSTKAFKPDGTPYINIVKISNINAPTTAPIAQAKQAIKPKASLLKKTESKAVDNTDDFSDVPF